MRKIKYPSLEAEMAKRGNTQQTLANLLDISIPSVNRRLSGEKDWSIGEIEILCNYYGKDYYELFK